MDPQMDGSMTCTVQFSWLFMSIATTGERYEWLEHITIGHTQSDADIHRPLPSPRSPTPFHRLPIFMDGGVRGCEIAPAPSDANRSGRRPSLR